MKRKHISWKTKCAAAVWELQWMRAMFASTTGEHVPYDHAKEMTETQFLSLFQWDHNKLWTNDGGDHFSNLSPEFIKAHREKTKRDAKIIAKGRRIRAKHPLVAMGEAMEANTPEWQAFQAQLKPHVGGIWRGKQYKLRSRGFDKRYKRKMSGKVVPR